MIKIKIEQNKNEILLYRVGETEMGGGMTNGMFFTDDIDYFDNTLTGHKKEDAKKYYFDLNCNIWDPMTEYNLDNDGWEQILVPYDLDPVLDSCDPANEEETLCWACTDDLAYIGKKRGYDATVIRGIYELWGYRQPSKQFDEYVVYNTKYLRKAE